MNGKVQRATACFSSLKKEIVPEDNSCIIGGATMLFVRASAVIEAVGTTSRSSAGVGTFEPYAKQGHTVVDPCLCNATVSGHQFIEVTTVAQVVDG